MSLAFVVRSQVWGHVELVLKTLTNESPHKKNWFDATCDCRLANKGVEDIFITKVTFLGEHENELQKNGFF